MKIKLIAGLLFLFISYFGYGQGLTVTLPQNPTLCSGAQIVLNATVNGGTAPYKYLWSTGAVSSAVIANKDITYSVTVTDAVGNKATAQVSVVAIARPGAPAVISQNVIVCPGAAARLEVANPLANVTYHWYNANGDALPATGAVLITDPITQNSTFFVDATVSECTSERTAIVVTLRENPVVRPVSVCAGSAATFIATGADSYTWYDAAGNVLASSGATFTSGPLAANTIFYVTGTTNGCTSAKVEARANVKPKPASPNAGGLYEVCSGSKVTLTASGVNNAIYEWFSQSSGGVPIISSPDFTTPVLTQDATYYVQATIDGCSSDRVAVNVTVSQPPPLPAVSAIPAICYNSTAQLSISNPVAGVTYNWYTTAASTQVYRTGTSVTTAALITNTTFYVRAARGSCIGDVVPVQVTVGSPVVAPTVDGATVICPGSTLLTATAPAGTLFTWYDAAGVKVFEGADFNAPATSNRSYYVTVTNSDNCESARTRVDITVTSPPNAPAGVDVRTCLGSAATLRATGAVNYLWYDAQTGGVPIGTGPTLLTNPITVTTNYYVSAVDASGCESLTRTRVRAIAVATPAVPGVGGGGTICEGTSATLTASGSTGSYEWWNDEFNGVRLGTGSTFSTGNLTGTTTFWVQAVTPEGCASPRRARTVTVTPRVRPQFKYSSGTYCTSSPATTPVEYVAGTFSASPAGISIQTSNGRIDPSASVPGTYTITFTPSGGACNTPTSTTIVITGVPLATFSYPNTVYCNDGSATPVFDVNASAGVFSASGTGLVFSDNTTGQINLGNSTPGSYTITNTITTLCDTVSATFNITINRGVDVNAGNNITLQAGNTVQLNGSVSVPGLGVTWTSSNPADVFSDANSLNTTYTPAATSGTVTLTLTTADPDPGGPCDAGVSTLTVRIITRPAPPTIANPTVCYDSPASLTPTAPGGTYKWYTQASGGTSFFTGTLVTGNLITDTVFYVTATINGLESDRTIVTVRVNPAIAEPTVTGGGAVCPGPVTLAVNETADAYEWRDANGNLKSTNKTYTPTVNQNTSFSVRIRVGNCFSPSHRVDLTVNPTATVSSASSGEICSGSAQNYTITSATPGVTFTYRRDQVNGISEAAVSNISATQITEVLTNTTNNELAVTYVITPYVNECAGTPFTYVVTVLPAPVIKSAVTATVCNQTSLNYLVQMNPSINSYFSWSRAAVPGISNETISGQESLNIRESLHNTTNAAINVVYTFNYGTATCAGAPFTLTVTVNPEIAIDSDDFTFACSGAPVGYQITSPVNGTTFRWRRLTSLPGQPAPATFTSSSVINDVLTNNTTQQQFVDYFVIPSYNGCDGTPISLRVILAPAIPKPEINSNTPVCVDKTIILNSTVTGEKYVWTSSDGAFRDTTTVPYVSITATTSGTFRYSVEVIRGSCSNTSDLYTVEVYQKPVANPGGDRTVCYDATSVPLSGHVKGHVDGRAIGGVWDIVTGGGTFSQDKNVLANAYIPTQADREAGSVVLSLTSLDASDCSQDIKLITIKFDRVRAADTQADRTKEICSGVQVTYDIATTADGAAGLTYSWTRNAVGGNGPIPPGTTKTINETLINNTLADIVITYTITPSLDGCAGEPFELRITVKPAIPKKAFTATLATVCVNKPIELVYPDDIAGATYLWTGPNGIVGPPNSRTFTLANGISTPGPATFNLTVRVGNCEIASEPVTIEVRPAPVVNAGADQTVCPDEPFIQLHGTVTSGVNGPTIPGRWEKVIGNGNILNLGQLNARYEPTPAERTPGTIVVLRLLSAGSDNCDIETDDVTYTFQKTRAANAGPDREVCEQRFELNGQILVSGASGQWDGGSGNFLSGRNSLTGTYIPSQAEVNAGTVTLTLIANGAGPCDETSDQVTFKLVPPPTVLADAHPIRYGEKGKTIMLNPIVSADNVAYQWTESPAVGSISNPNVKNPFITVADVDVTYTLIVTSANSCVSVAATVLVKSSPKISTPNTFTPNADGFNDLWLIAGMEAYPNAVVDIYDRAGRPVYHSIGYARPWDGTNSGKPVPFGTYYFIINVRGEEQQKVTGYVTVVR